MSVPEEPMTPEQRAVVAAGLFLEMLRVLPPVSAQLTSSREELEERERRGRQLGQQMREVLHPDQVSEE